MALRPLLAGFAVAFAAILAGCTPEAENTDSVVAAAIDRIGLAELQRSPEQADILGLSAQAFGHDYRREIDSRSIAAVEKGRIARLAALAELEQIDRSTLTPGAQRRLDAALHVIGAAVRIERHGYGYASLGWASPYLINPSDGAWSDLIKFLTIHHPIRSRADAEAWLARLKQVPTAIRDERWRFEIDIEQGASPPKFVLQHTLNRVRSLTPANPAEHQLTLYFTEALSQIPDLPEDDIKKLSDEAAKIIANDVTPAYVDLAKTIETAMAKAHEEPGVWRLRGGEAYYQDALHLFTSTDLTPKQVHDLGLQLVTDISKRMDPILTELGYAEGGVGERMHAMAQDPQFIYPDTDEGRAALLAALQSQIDWASGRMSRMFSDGPRRPVEIRQAPAISRETAPAAYYKAPALDGSRPATYNLNLRLADWPSWALPTLTYHEALPGHHLQAGLARERWQGPILTLITATPALSEGWAVYGEDLADELGAYVQDPRGRLGYLQSLLFRAARLVADTGIHSERWTRQQAVDYLVETTGLPRADMEPEVERYAIWPGQASAYMVGRETIRRLRNSADRELGPDFDLKAFHDAVLAGGGRPLPILEADIADWVVSRRRPAAAN